MRILKQVLLLFVFIYMSTATVVSAESVTIGGTISLPDGVSAFSTDRTIEVHILKDWNGTWFSGMTTCDSSVTLPANQRTTTYQCSVSDVSGELALRVWWGYSGENIVGENYYNSNGTTWSYVAAEHLSAGNVYTGIDVSLLEATQVSGVLHTPAGESFSEDKYISILRVNELTVGSGSTYRVNSGDSVTLLAGAEEVSYSMDVPIAANPYRIQYYWSTPPSDFLAEGYYNVNGTVYGFGQATTLDSTAPQSNIDMTLLHGVPINGTVYLPAGVTNSQNITLNIWVHDKSYTLSQSQSVTIIAGTGSAEFTVSVPTDIKVQFGYNSVSGADDVYMPRGYYTSNGTITQSWLAEEVLASSGAPHIDLTLIPGVKFSGTVVLPGGVTYPQPVEGNIGTSPHVDAWGYFTIPAGDTSAVWSLVMLPQTQNIVVSASLSRYNYDPDPAYLPSSYYNSQGTAGIIANGEPLDGSIDQENLAITLQKGNILSGVISLQSPDQFLVDGSVYLTAYWGNDWYDASSLYIPVTTGDVSASYSLTIPKDAPNYRLRYSAWSAPASYVREAYYNNSQDGYCESDAESFTAGLDYPNTDITMLQNFTIDGDINLPTGASETVDIPVSIGALYLPQGEEFPASMQGHYMTTVTIISGTSSAQYGLTLPPVCTTTPGDYLVGYNQNNENYVHNGFYNSTVAVTVGKASNSTLLPEGQSYSGINMDLMAGNEISGTVTLPVGETAPENGLPVTLGTLQEPNGLYHTTVTIEQNTFSAPYSIRVAPDVGNVALGYWLLSSPSLAERGYYSTQTTLASNVTGRFDYADMFDSTTSHENNNFTLEVGSEVSGRLYAPEVADHNVPIEITLAADPVDPDTVYWHTVMTVRPGTRSLSYNHRIVLDSDIVVQYKNDTYASWSTQGYYFDSSMSVSDLATATTLTAEQDHGMVDLFLSDMLTGDLNFDGTVDLVDAIIGLQIMTGVTISEEIAVAADVNGDGILSLPEVVYILNNL